MTNSNSSLLTSQEKIVCEQVSLRNQSPHNKRAQALLIINEGLTQVNAGQQVGLSLGQVRYCLQRFRQLRCDIFPAGLQLQSTTMLQVKSESKPSSDNIKEDKKGKKDKTKNRKDKKKKKAQKAKKKEKDKSEKKKDKIIKGEKKSSKKNKAKKSKKKNG